MYRKTFAGDGFVFDSNDSTTKCDFILTEDRDLRVTNANLDMNSNRVINIGTPLNGSDCVTKSYVDNMVSQFDFKNSCRVASTGNVDVDNLFVGNSIDNVVLAANDRVLIKDQTDATRNNIYIMQSNSITAVVADMLNVEDTLTPGTVVAIEEGDTNADQLFILTTNGPITIGATNLNWSILATSGMHEIRTNQTSVKTTTDTVEMQVNSKMLLELKDTQDVYITPNYQCVIRNNNTSAEINYSDGTSSWDSTLFFQNRTGTGRDARLIATGLSANNNMIFTNYSTNTLTDGPNWIWNACTASSNTNRMILDNANGYLGLGLGTNTPTSAFHTYMNEENIAIKIESVDGEAGIEIESISATIANQVIFNCGVKNSGTGGLQQSAGHRIWSRCDTRPTYYGYSVMSYPDGGSEQTLLHIDGSTAYMGVGLGNTSPSAPLHVNSSTNTEPIMILDGDYDVSARLESTVNAEVYLELCNLTTGTDSWTMGLNDDDNFHITNGAKGTINGTTNLFIKKSNGYVGIGTTTPSYQLELSTNSAGKPSSSTWEITSDRRVKQNIVDADLDHCKNIVKNIRLRLFNYTDDYAKQIGESVDKLHLGFIAQEVKAVCSRCVKVHDKMNVNGKEYKDFHTLDIDNLIKHVIGTVQHQMKTIDRLTTDVKNLKAVKHVRFESDVRDDDQDDKLEFVNKRLDQCIKSLGVAQEELKTLNEAVNKPVDKPVDHTKTIEQMQAQINQLSVQLNEKSADDGYNTSSQSDMKIEALETQNMLLQKRTQNLERKLLSLESKLKKGLVVSKSHTA